MTTGHSGTQLWRQLGLQDGMLAVVLNPAGRLHRHHAGRPDVRWGDRVDGAAFVHLFTVSRTEMETVLAAAMPLIDRDGIIWVSWPKKAAKVVTDIS